MKQVIGVVRMIFVLNPVVRGPPVHFANPDRKAEGAVPRTLFREIPKSGG